MSIILPIRRIDWKQLEKLGYGKGNPYTLWTDIYMGSTTAGVTIPANDSYYGSSNEAILDAVDMIKAGDYEQIIIRNKNFRIVCILNADAVVPE